MPTFSPGQRVILFLEAHQDGTYRVVELMLGAFKEVPVATARDMEPGASGRASYALGQTGIFMGGLVSCSAGTRITVEIAFPTIDRHNRMTGHNHTDAEINEMLPPPKGE